MGTEVVEVVSTSNRCKVSDFSLGVLELLIGKKW